MITSFSSELHAFSTQMCGWEAHENPTDLIVYREVEIHVSAGNATALDRFWKIIPFEYVESGWSIVPASLRELLLHMRSCVKKGTVSNYCSSDFLVLFIAVFVLCFPSFYRGYSKYADFDLQVQLLRLV
ncbi:hypothetical protein CRM22_004469 [Opisthorchis felineus]|uniref:Uncharacterized protein n=1 Tax=Opisthorchis felineus TaxID=147828 RepID=A0A4S2M2C8_OPIFE|nr:hypothetical protein CRM22_004469 [Opisthorchis felineus]